jgi:DNA-directed RNA polymerase subunit RPC12/RpoP
MTKRSNDKITCSDCNYSWYVYQKDVGMNVYECEKCGKINLLDKIMYSEEEVRELLTQRCKHFSTNVKPFNELLMKQDLEWFEQNKKK